MRITVVGSGYVGLVAGACLAELGHDVILVDNDLAKFAALMRGECPIHEQYLRNFSIDTAEFVSRSPRI